VVLAIYIGLLVTLTSAALCVSYFIYGFFSISSDTGIFPRSLYEDIEVYKLNANRSVVITCLIVAMLTLYICV
jgi:hypothetical protein